jgi:formate hydrogenlyase subunit 6/NADH:ubiquinone oxidoreductase subunit I
MQIDREIGASARLGDFGHSVTRLQGQCIGCDSCRGICSTLLDMVSVPGIVLKDNEE